MSLLDRISGPADLRGLDRTQLETLSREIRDFLIANVSRTGGHLGPNLGVVELTIAMHRVFDSPRDPIIFDTGHQSYVHKIVTGRRSLFPTLRQAGGLSGYPNRAESEHDWIENSHASSALSWGAGMARGFQLAGADRTVVVLVGDGALTGGMAWEALNNIAVAEGLRLVIVVNDNGRSYTPTVGGLAQQLAGMRTDRRYEAALQFIKRRVTGLPLIGRWAYELLHGFKTGIKDILAPQGMFSDLGMKYIGPVNGHDIAAVELGLTQAKNFDGPVIVHCITRKGYGFQAAEDHAEDHFHAVGRIHETTGEPLTPPGASTWTEVFSAEMVRLGAEDERVVALTAAMLHPVGLAAFARAYPDRTLDVGIAEQHAVATAAGLATAGLHPVVAIYATFLNRAFDQVLMDVALHSMGVTFVLDRAGVTGPDGASHNGMWDLAMLAMVPGLRLTAPRDASRLRQALDTALAVTDAPTVIRFSKETCPAELPAVRTFGDVDVLLESPRARVLLVGYGQFAHLAVEAGQRLRSHGIGVSVVDPVWSLPVSPSLVALAASHELVVTVEDGLVDNGLGAQLARAVAEAGLGVPVRNFGIPKDFLPQGARDQILEELGLTAQTVARVATECLLASTEAPADATSSRLNS